MKIDQLKEKEILIWGLGREGLSSLDYLHEIYPTQTIYLYDDRASELQEFQKNYTKPLKLVERDVDQVLDQIDVIVKSPGVSLYKPEIELAKQKGIKITSASNLWFANFSDNCKTIAITGTKGKSTTASLIYHLLSKQDVTVSLAGNIGTPLLELRHEANDYVVMELSSYQTADLEYGSDIALLLNLYPEHIQWHGTHEQYFLDKLNLFKHSNGRAIFYNPYDKLSIKHIDHNFDWKPYLPQKVSQINHEWYVGEPLQNNLSAALAVLNELGYFVHDLQQDLKDFQTLPCRLEKVKEVNGRVFIDDCLSTTPESCLAALKAFQHKPLILLLGGQNRNQDISVLVEYLETHPIEKIYLMGEVSEEWQSQLPGSTVVEVNHDMDDVVQTAFENASEGAVILLSPAAPSYDQYENYLEKSKAFKKALNQI